MDTDFVHAIVQDIGPAIDTIADRVAAAVMPGAPAITNRDRVRQAVRSELRHILLNFKPAPRPAVHDDSNTDAGGGNQACCR